MIRVGSCIRPRPGRSGRTVRCRPIPTAPANQPLSSATTQRVKCGGKDARFELGDVGRGGSGGITGNRGALPTHHQAALPGDQQMAKPLTVVPGIAEVIDPPFVPLASVVGQRESLRSSRRYLAAGTRSGLEDLVVWGHARTLGGR